MPTKRTFLTNGVSYLRACGIKIIPRQRPDMNPPASPVSEMPIHWKPTLLVTDSRKRTTKRITIMKIRMILSIPAPFIAFQLTMMEASKPETNAIMHVILPTEGSDCTQIENKLPRIPARK